MCGVAGAIFFDESFKSTKVEEIVKNLCEGLHRRGPDNMGFWFSKNQKIGLGHNRLSIIDLNNRSNQPMVSEDRNYIISYNGEIYNFKKIKKSLEEKNIIFKTKSDTEVILKLYELKGKKMLHMLEGMFAIAIWDKKKEVLFLARDPYGIKPLYVAKHKKGYLFSSQVKSIINTNEVSLNLDKIGVLSFFLFGNVIEPNTCFKNIFNLKSGHYCLISKKHGLKIHKYYDIKKFFDIKGSNRKLNNNFSNAVKQSIHNSIKKHTISDVPIGVMLSGGIDSTSLIAHLIDLRKKVVAITIVFEEFKNTSQDELPYAKSFLKGKKIKHIIRRVSKNEFFNDIEEIMNAMDQPSIDGINTWYACKAASENNIKVLLSGVGGDELFFGYPSFNQIPKLINVMKFLEKIFIGKKIIKHIENLLSNYFNNEKWKYLHKLGINLYGAYWLKRGVFTPNEINKTFSKLNKKNIIKEIDIIDFLKKRIGKISSDKKLAIAQMENFFYLRNQLLRDSDWASMYHSVELRTPFVDSRLLEKLKFYYEYLSKFKNKRPLVDSSLTPIPKIISNRKKTGFNIPAGRWIKEISKRNKNSKNCYWFNDYKFLANYVINNIYKNLKPPFNV